MSAIRNLTNRRIAPVLLFPFLMNAVGMMTGSVLILYALDLKATLLDISLMTLIGNAMGVALRIPFGILSDRIGRKPMILLPELLVTSADLVRASATEPWHLIVANSLGGLAGDFFANLLSIVGDLAEPSELSSCVSTLYFCSSLGMIAGPAMASGLLLFTNIRSLMYISLFARLGLILYILRLIKEPERTSPRKISYRGSITNLLKKRNMIAGMVIAAFFFIMNSVEWTFVPIFARKNLSLSNSEVASLQTFRSLTVMTFRFFSNEIFVRTGYKRLILTMLLLCGVIGFSFQYSRDFITIAALEMIYGISFGALSLSGAILTSMSSDASNRGVANAVHSLAQSSGMITPLFLTPIADNHGVPAVFSIGAVVPIIGAILVVFVMKEPSRSN